MARRVVSRLIDDLDGSDADGTIEFGLDGVRYTIDLLEKNTGKLRKALDPYLAAATRVGRTGADRRPVRGSRVAAVSHRDRNRAIREWVVAHGHEVSKHGRIPTVVVQAYAAAQ